MTGEVTVWRPAELQDYAGSLLLDTHIWVWYLEGDADRLGSDLLALLERSGRGGELRVSDISFWEVALKTSQGKLVFSVDPVIWLRRAEKAPGIQSLPLDRDVLILSTRLGESARGDPADRMLIAAATLYDLPLVTADRLILEYAQEHAGTPVVDARS